MNFTHADQIHDLFQFLWPVGFQVGNEKNTLAVFLDLCHPVIPGCNKVVFQCKVGFFKSRFHFDYIGGFIIFFQYLKSQISKLFHHVSSNISMMFIWYIFKNPTNGLGFEKDKPPTVNLRWVTHTQKPPLSSALQVKDSRSRTQSRFSSSSHGWVVMGFLLVHFRTKTPAFFWANWKDIIPTVGPRKGSSQQGILWKNWQQIVWCIMS